jgi:hypothetical protein
LCHGKASFLLDSFPSYKANKEKLKGFLVSHRNYFLSVFHPTFRKPHLKVLSFGLSKRKLLLMDKVFSEIFFVFRSALSSFART